MIESTEPTSSPGKAPRRQRDLTAQEAGLLKKLKTIGWVVDCQITPPGYEGPGRAISYLARYFTGVAISDSRLVSDSGGIVVFSYKDYRDAEVRKLLSMPGAEFIRRFMLHILPRNMARVRHSGLFMPAERALRLAKCRELLKMARQERAEKQNAPAAAADALTGDVDDEVEEREVPKAGSCQCRFCKSEAELVGRLKGSETMWTMNVAHQIVMQLGTLLPGIDEAAVKELLGQVRSCWLTLRFLPGPIADLLRGQHFTSLEMAALEARLWHELRQSPMAASLGLVRESTSAVAECTSGIPPPVVQVATTP